MFNIKTRDSQLPKFDNTFPNVSLAFNNKDVSRTVRTTIVDIFTLLMDNNSRKLLSDIALSQFSKYILNVLEVIFKVYTNPSVYKSHVNGLNFMTFSDKRIGILGVTDSEIPSTNPIVQLKTKHCFDYAALRTCTTVYELEAQIWQFADNFIKWVNFNYFGSRNIVYHGTLGKYIELLIEDTYLTKDERDRCTRYIDNCLSKPNEVVRLSCPRGVKFLEVLRA